MIRFQILSRSAVFRTLPLLACLASLGCGGESLYRLSGKVTFNGKPVPLGKIYFQPDSTKGNAGPTGYANIVDGNYDTGQPGGRGVPPGPVTVAIEGQDPSQVGKNEKDDKSGEKLILTLFPRYQTTYEVTASGTKDFEVPPGAAIVKPDKKSNVVYP